MCEKVDFTNFPLLTKAVGEYVSRTRFAELVWFMSRL